LVGTSVFGTISVSSGVVTIQGVNVSHVASPPNRAIHVSGATFTLLDSVVTGIPSGINDGIAAAAIVGNDAWTTLRRCRIERNAVLPMWYGSGELSVEDTLIAENTSNFLAGGLAFREGALTMTRSAIVGNQSTAAGALSIATPHPSSLTNVTISGNVGLTAVSVNSTDLRLSYVTIAENQVELATIVTFGGRLTLLGVILDAGGAINCGGENDTFTSLGLNLVSDDTCGTAAAGDVRTADAMLDVLADNGGFTSTHLPLPNSPAIDSGDGKACPATDQRGISRPQGTLCDSGAVEVEPSEFRITRRPASARPPRAPNISRARMERVRQ
jgi:hypothetical protein